MNKSWSVGLAAWILTDGNYNGFEVGETRQFALEFYSKAFEQSELNEKTATLLNRTTYRVNALVDYIDSEMWVLDFGIKAYAGRPDARLAGNPLPPLGAKIEQFLSSLEVGQYIMCDLYLGIDHFLYMESLCSNPGAIPLIYSWKIDSIYQFTGVTVKGETGNDEIDSSTALWQPSGSTYPRLPNFIGEYELQCTLQPLQPTSDGFPLANWDGSRDKMS